MDVYGPLIAIDFATPNAIKYLFARKNAAGVEHKELKQSIFRGSKSDFPFPAHN